MELAVGSGGNAPGGLTVAAPSYVFIIGRVAEMLGEDEEWLQTIADDMEPEDGRIIFCGTDEMSITAFTPFGIESLEELMPMYRQQSNKGSKPYTANRRGPHRMDTAKVMTSSNRPPRPASCA
jgi:hypothetical protein